MRFAMCGYLALCWLWPTIDALAAAEKEDKSSIGARAIPAKDFLTVLRRDKVPIPSSRSGAMIFWVLPGGPADVAGLRSLDIVRKIDDRAVVDDQAFVQAVSSLAPASPAKFYLLRFDLKAKVPRWQPATITITPSPKEEVDRMAERQCPVELTAATLRTNRINLPELAITVKNVSLMPVTAVEIDAKCFDRFGEAVGALGSGSNLFRGISQTTLAAGEERVFRWQLSVHANTTKALVAVSRVKKAQGEWRADKDTPAAAINADLSN